MTARTVVPRERALQDINDAIDFYFAEGGAELALNFIDELEASFLQFSSQPDSGSLRYSSELDIPYLRYWPMRRFPYLIFYMPTAEMVDVWRVLHAKRDIPVSMQRP